ncbi:MAG TPA: hypothetical protein VFC06_07330 [Demequina sp.]|nr:hypothetical protein [Demequina sp.]
MTSWPLTSREAWSSMISTWVTASVRNFSVDLVTGRPPRPEPVPARRRNVGAAPGLVPVE